MESGINGVIGMSVMSHVVVALKRGHDNVNNPNLEAAAVTVKAQKHKTAIQTHVQVCTSRLYVFLRYLAFLCILSIHNNAFVCLII